MKMPKKRKKKVFWLVPEDDSVLTGKISLAGLIVLDSRVHS